MLAILYIKLGMKKGHVMKMEFGLREEAEKIPNIQKKEVVC
jgi:hypothetical protein